MGNHVMLLAIQPPQGKFRCKPAVKCATHRCPCFSSGTGCAPSCECGCGIECTNYAVVCACDESVLKVTTHVLDGTVVQCITCGVWHHTLCVDLKIQGRIAEEGEDFKCKDRGSPCPMRDLCAHGWSFPAPVVGHLLTTALCIASFAHDSRHVQTQGQS
jgi:hypothetical protein